MGSCASKDTGSPLELQVSYQITMNTTEPENGQTKEFVVDALSLDTVAQLLSKAAVKLGLDQKHSAFLQLKVAEGPVSDISKTLEDLELEDQGRVELLGDVSHIQACMEADIMAAVLQGDARMVEGMTKYFPERVSTQGKYGESALHLAANTGSADIASLLLSAKADPNLPDKAPCPSSAAGLILAVVQAGETPVHNAARNNSAAVLSELLNAGAHLDTRNKQNVTPLFLAARADGLQAVNALLESVVDAAVSNTSLMTPLHSSVIHGNEEITQQLLAAKADPNAKDVVGDTPLHKLSGWGNSNIGLRLLESGADASITNKAGVPALEEGMIQDGQLSDISREWLEEKAEEYERAMLEVQLLVKKVVRLIDRDCDGHLAKVELEDAFGKCMSEEKWVAFLKEFDSDSDGKISVDEFVTKAVAESRLDHGLTTGFNLEYWQEMVATLGGRASPKRS